MDRQRESFGARLIFMIAHRLATAMHTAVIHVHDKCWVMESGAHDQLMVLGAYASSWLAQMREIGSTGF